MNVLTLGIHYPDEAHFDDFIGATRTIAAKARELNGLIDTGAWRHAESGGVVLLSLWMSQECADAARPILTPLVKMQPFSDWEARPPQQFFQIERLV